DTVFVVGNTVEEGFRGLLMAQVHLFLSIVHCRVTYPCALVEWFSTIGEEPCTDTGMWMVEPDFNALGKQAQSVIHLGSILHCAHLMPVAGNVFISQRVKFHNSLDAFQAYYVNKYIDHHAHEIAF
ncbi:hypothetical protein CPB84DRAFT_1680498, partial [Gymnopilus junonius]